VAEKARGVKFCMHVLLSGQVFSRLVNIGLRGVTCRRRHKFRYDWLRRMNCVPAWHGHSELGAAALCKAIWWGMHLASLLTHLFLLTSPAGAVAKYCEESVCLSARISPEPHVRSLPHFLCTLPMSVARCSSGMLMIGCIAYRREGVTGVHRAGEV